jgi:SH3 domain protein
MKYFTSTKCIILLCINTSVLAQESGLPQEHVIERNSTPITNIERDVIHSSTVADVDQTSSLKPDNIEEETNSATAKNLKAYITDEFYVPVRSLPDTNGRVIHKGLKSGTSLQLIEASDGWSRIKTEFDLEGWIQTRYVKTDPIAKVLLTLADQKNKQLESLNKELEKAIKVEQPTKELARQKIAALSIENERLTNELGDFSSKTARAMATQDQIQSLVSHNNLLTQQNDVLKARLSNFEKDDLYRSFLYGGLAVFLGAILSALVPRLRGRRRFQEWG